MQTRNVISWICALENTVRLPVLLRWDLHVIYPEVLLVQDPVTLGDFLMLKNTRKTCTDV